MNCLLTGANGFLGKIISSQISKTNFVFSLSRYGSNFNFSLEKQVPDFNLQFDLVIHAAGKAHIVSKTESEKQEFYNINVVGTKNLLEGLTKTGIPKYFVFISSVSVYGKDFGNDHDENTHLGALDPYGISKIEAERIVLDWCKQHNVVCTIFRLPLVVGINPPGNLKAMINGIKHGYYFNIGGGRAKKSMVLAEDVAKSIIDASSVGGVYNLTDGCHPSFDELSNHISIQLGKGKPMNMPIWLARTIAKFGDLLGSKAPLNTNILRKITSDLTFDDIKARKAFGWNPKPILEGFRINKY
jgi:nucleoside-diphosphate-sugar epimerase